MTRPKAVYMALRGMLPQGGQEIACKPLLDCLCVAMTCHQGAAVAPSTLVPMPPTFPNPHIQQQFLAYQVQILHPNFPQLQDGSQHQSAVLIAQGISTC